MEAGYRALAVAVLLQLAADARDGLLTRHPADWNLCVTLAEEVGMNADTLRQRVCGLADGKALTPSRRKHKWRQRPELRGRKCHALSMDARVTARLSQEAIQRLHQRAKEAGMPVSTYAKRVLERDCADNATPAQEPTTTADAATADAVPAQETAAATVLPPPPEDHEDEPQPKRRRRGGWLY